MTVFWSLLNLVDFRISETAFLSFENNTGRTDGPKDERKDRRADRRRNGQTDIMIQLSIGSETDLTIYQPMLSWCCFCFKITLDLCSLIILSLHRKCKNQKSKKIATWQIQFLRWRFFSKCKNVKIFPVLKLSMGTMFFSKISNLSIC